MDEREDYFFFAAFFAAFLAGAAAFLAGAAAFFAGAAAFLAGAFLAAFFVANFILEIDLPLINLVAAFFTATTAGETFPPVFVLAFGATTALADEFFAAACFTLAWLIAKFPLLVKGIVFSGAASFIGLDAFVAENAVFAGLFATFGVTAGGEAGTDIRGTAGDTTGEDGGFHACSAAGGVTDRGGVASSSSSSSSS